MRRESGSPGGDEIVLRDKTAIYASLFCVLLYLDFLFVASIKFLYCILVVLYGQRHVCPHNISVPLNILN